MCSTYVLMVLYCFLALLYSPLLEIVHIPEAEARLKNSDKQIIIDGIHGDGIGL